MDLKLETLGNFANHITKLISMLVYSLILVIKHDNPEIEVSETKFAYSDQVKSMVS